MLEKIKRLALWLGLVENDQQCTDCYAVGDEPHHWECITMQECADCGAVGNEPCTYDCMCNWEPCVNMNPDGCATCNVGENQRCWSLACVDYDPNCKCAYCRAAAAWEEY